MCYCLLINFYFILCTFCYCFKVLRVIENIIKYISKSPSSLVLLSTRLSCFYSVFVPALCFVVKQHVSSNFSFADISVIFVMIAKEVLRNCFATGKKNHHIIFSVKNKNIFLSQYDYFQRQSFFSFTKQLFWDFLENS